MRFYGRHLIINACSLLYRCLRLVQKSQLHNHWCSSTLKNHRILPESLYTHRPNYCLAKVVFNLKCMTSTFTCNKMIMHHKCRGVTYPSSDKTRQPVTDAQVSWETPFPDYDPPNHSAAVIFGKPWADAEICNSTFCPKWHEIDGDVDRRSFVGTYQIINGYPRNPIGRTGLRGRGLLGRWGPNHACDPIVTRWKRDASGSKVFDQQTGLPLLQFVAIQRSDSKEWAIPGGMVDLGEQVSQTLKREFGEEALNSLQLSEEDKKDLLKHLEDLFKNGTTVYMGYVDDPRNTDNAWMETVAANFHDESGSIIGRVTLTSGDDAIGVQWMNVDNTLNLYASHKDFLQKTAQLRNAHWG